MALDGIGGFEAVDDAGQEGLADLALFIGHYIEMPGETVLPGVEAGLPFACIGAGASRLLRVEAVRFDLFVGRHSGNSSGRRSSTGRSEKRTTGLRVAAGKTRKGAWVQGDSGDGNLYRRVVIRGRELRVVPGLSRTDPIH